MAKIINRVPVQNNPSGQGFSLAKLFGGKNVVGTTSDISRGYQAGAGVAFAPVSTPAHQAAVDQAVNSAMQNPLIHYQARRPS